MSFLSFFPHTLFGRIGYEGWGKEGVEEGKGKQVAEEGTGEGKRRGMAKQRESNNDKGERRDFDETEGEGRKGEMGRERASEQNGMERKSRKGRKKRNARMRDGGVGRGRATYIHMLK